MGRTIESYESGDLQDVGKCGIKYLLIVEYKKTVTTGPLPALLDYTDTRYFKNYFRKEVGCHIDIGNYIQPDATIINNFKETKTKNPDGTTTRTMEYFIRIDSAEYCGVCFNPGETSFRLLNDVYSTVGGTDADAGFYGLKVQRWARTSTLPKGKTELPGEAARRYLLEWFDLFDIPSGQGLEIENPCLFGDRSICTLN